MIISPTLLNFTVFHCAKIALSLAEFLEGSIHFHVCAHPIAYMDHILTHPFNDRVDSASSSLGLDQLLEVGPCLSDQEGSYQDGKEHCEDITGLS